MAALAALAAGAGVVRLLPWLCPFPEERFGARRPARLYLDARGQVIRADSGIGSEWRLPVTLDDVSPWLVQATLAVEDHRFLRHAGIDPRAVVRAAVQNLRAGRVVSGASTLSMQVARLAAPEPRSALGKVRQAGRALDLERRHDKDWILLAYLNHAPYGGTLVGAEAAARGYFGTSARDLSLGQAALLAGLPQRPSALRPDRHPAAARRRQKHVLARMVAAGFITPEMAATAWHPGPDWQPASRVAKADTRVGYPIREGAFCAVAARATRASRVRTTLDPVLQRVVREALRRQVDTLAGCADGAAVVLDSRSGHLLALVGGVATAAGPGREVNHATARRSPGSALKPFLYLAALDDGLLLPDTRLPDTPLPYPDYRPGNFDGTHRREVTARDALVRSLNAPAVRVLEALGVEYGLSRLRDCGLRSLDAPAEHYGLSLALGGGEVTLLELTGAYAGLARGGRFFPPVPLARPPPAGTRPFAAGSVALLNDMLCTAPLPGAPGLALAWKTGTSNGFRDAWCLAYNPEFTVGVWLGNTSGRPARSLVGAEAAAPVVATLFRALYRERPPPAFPGELAETVPLRLCTLSGLAAGAGCQTSFAARAPAGLPGRRCARCGTAAAHPGQAARVAPLAILAPEPGTYRARGDGVVRLPLAADASDCSWFVDGRFLARASAPLPPQPFVPGRHRVTCVAHASGLVSDVLIVVR